MVLEFTENKAFPENAGCSETLSSRWKKIHLNVIQEELLTPIGKYADSDISNFFGLFI